MHFWLAYRNFCQRKFKTVVQGIKPQAICCNYEFNLQKPFGLRVVRLNGLILGQNHFQLQVKMSFDFLVNN